MELKVYTTKFKKLRETCIDYLTDAGFSASMYDLVENEEKGCLEVFFRVDEAIDYVVEDLVKTKWKQLLTVKKYCFYNKYRALFYKK